jgi:hypothetical protein
VEEAEAPFAQLPNDVYVLRWLNLGVDAQLAAPMIAAECEILYATAGTQSFGGLDRGRMLSAMDEEINSIVQPCATQKMNYNTQPPAALLTQVFWETPVYTPVAALRDKLSRSAKLTIYSYQEQGE